MKRHALLTLVLFAAAAHVRARPAAQPRNACELLTKTEVAAVQGQPFTGTKLTTSGPRSQCFYELPSFVQSVSVDVLRSNAAEYWREHFGEEARETRESAGEGEEEEKEGPLRISGIGREAFWTGNRTGSLYVFRGDAVLRISVGGPGTQSEKIARAKKLAARALRRL